VTPVVTRDAIYKNLKMVDISFLSIKIFVEVSIARYEKMVKEYNGKR
jgi:hypothetical protein